MTFEEIVEGHGHLVYRQARLLTADPHLAQDVTQNVFVRLYRHLREVRDPVAWLMRVTHNEAMRAMRGRGMRMEEIPEDVPDAAGDPAHLYEGVEIVAALDALPASAREVLVLAYYEDLRPGEIARLLGLPEGTARSRLSRARAMLRRRLEEGTLNAARL